MIGVVRKCCPLCGGRIIVSDLYQVSYDYFITKSGVISRKHKTSRPASIEASIASCENSPDKCRAYWDTDSFFVDMKGRFVDLQYDEESEVK